MANHIGISFFKNNVLYEKSCTVFTELVYMKLDKLFQQNCFKANDFKEQERREIYASV